MSQKASRKAVVSDEKEKRTDSPVKDMKKKMAANAEKEKQAADKTVDKVEKTAEKEKPAEKTEKPVEKPEKDKPAEKKAEKSDRKTETAPEKKEETNKEDKASKPEKEKQDPKKSKQNGNARVNGATNGESHNGTVSADDDEDSDEMFPELAYDSSDPEFEPDAPPRSFTRRSQAKAVRTPETPRPGSDKQDAAADDSKDSKVLKLKEDVPSTDRKLRSADSPKPQEKKADKQETPKETQEKPADKKEEEKSEESAKEKDKAEENVVEIVEIVEVEEHEEESRKPDTNYSKSRVKVSPYRRSVRLADQTASSMAANYTGNNTTMEMDITETSIASEDQSLNDSSYLSGLRTIRGRRSYKPLKEMTLRHVNASVRSNASGAGTLEVPARPTGTVVGRKRRPERSASVERGVEAEDALHASAEDALHAHGKRMRLLDRIFRRGEHDAEIVGINTDLPLTAPVAAEALNPEALKPVPLAHTGADRDNKRCAIM